MPLSCPSPVFVLSTDARQNQNERLELLLKDKEKQEIQEKVSPLRR